MDDKIYKSMEIMADIVKNSLFEDNKRIREVIRELISRIEMMLMQAGTKLQLEELLHISRLQHHIWKKYQDMIIINS